MTKETKVHVAIDLGGDTLKIAFGYQDDSGGKRRYNYGKFSSEHDFMQIGIPAVAFLSKRTGKWLFGADVDSSGEDDFTTVVHIKNLISLLAERRDKDVQKSNTDYYNKKNVFLKYYLPSERKHFKDLAQAEAEGRTFESPDTPKTVCENFFLYVKSLVDQGLERLSKETRIKFTGIECSVVYPSKVGLKFIAEYERLVCKAFGVKYVNRSLSSVKSLGVYAYRSGKVKDNMPFLVFDIGEEYISVAKLWFVDGTPFIDGTDGHKKQERIGGIDIDESIRGFIEGELDERETIATPSAGVTGHVNESCIDSQKYRFLKDIKKAKHILSTPLEEHSQQTYESVTLAVCRECYVRRLLKKGDFEKAIGLYLDSSDESSAAVRLAKYITEEVSDVGNNDVNDIFIAGGVIETTGLAGYIQKTLTGALDRRINVHTFDETNEKKFPERFCIHENESSVYAAVIGAAIVSTEDVIIKTVLALTYGTWGTLREEKVFSPIIERGADLNEKGYTEFESEAFSAIIPPNEYSKDPLVELDEVYSCILTRNDIAARRYSNKPHAPVYSGNYLAIGDENPQNAYKRRNAEQWYKLKTVVKSDIIIKYKGKRVSVRSLSGRLHLWYKECIRCDAEGRATISIKVSNVERDDDSLSPAYVNIRGYKDPIPVSDLEITWDPEPKFTVETNED